MKPSVPFFLLILFPLMSYAQSKDIRSRATYHSPGKLASKYEYYYDFWQEKEVFHGRFERWSNKGLLLQSLRYVDGLKDGLEIQHDTQGRLKSKIRWRKGLIHGTYQRFYPNGQLKDIYLYQEGQREGIFQRFYKHGLLKSRGSYHQGLLDGRTERFGPKGQLREDRSYVRGKKLRTANERHS